MNMFRSQGKSERSTSTSGARSHGLGAICATALLLIAGCTTIPRLDAKFDTDTLGALPSSTPAPTPPNDTLIWRTQFLSATVVNDSAGGRAVRIAPLPAFTASPDDRRVFLLALTEPFTTSPAANIRGHVRLRLVGLGTVGFGLRIFKSSNNLTSSAGSSCRISCRPRKGASMLSEDSTVRGSATRSGFRQPARSPAMTPAM